MLSSENAPQISSSFWNVGLESNTVIEIDHNYILRQAILGLAIEIERCSAPFGARRPITKQDQLKLAVDERHALEVMERILRQFDRSALTSQQPWQVPNNWQSRKIAMTFDGTPIEPSLWFEFALQTIRPRHELDADEAHKSQDELYTYGKRLGAVELAVHTITQFVQGSTSTKELMDLVKPHLHIYDDKTFIIDKAAAEAAIQRMIDQEPEACDLLFKRAAAVEKGHELFSRLKVLRKTHIAERRKKPSLLLLMQDDCLDIMSRHLDTTSAIAMKQSCKTFHNFKSFSLRIPHMHIRMLTGKFPHCISSSLDRDALMANRKQFVTRNFVVKKKNVFLYVDFVQQTLRTTPLKKKPRKDGLDNSLHDFSDDEFEEEPESPNLKRPIVGDHNQNTSYGARMHKLETKRQLEWDNAEGPREKVDRFMYNRRIAQEQYFSRPLEISVSLVFADTLQPANSSDFPDGIKPSNRYIANGSRFRKPCNFVDHEMPAQCKFNIPLLTSEYGGRRFRLKLTGKTSRRATLSPVSIISYSEPFEVVSDLGTIGRATKRKTAAEKSEFAREREKKKSRTCRATEAR